MSRATIALMMLTEWGLMEMSRKSITMSMSIDDYNAIKFLAELCPEDWDGARGARDARHFLDHMVSAEALKKDSCLKGLGRIDLSSFDSAISVERR